MLGLSKDVCSIDEMSRACGKWLLTCHEYLGSLLSGYLYSAAGYYGIFGTTLGTGHSTLMLAFTHVVGLALH